MFATAAPLMDWPRWITRSKGQLRRPVRWFRSALGRLFSRWSHPHKGHTSDLGWFVRPAHLARLEHWGLRGSWRLNVEDSTNLPSNRRRPGTDADGRGRTRRSQLTLRCSGRPCRSEAGRPINPADCSWIGRVQFPIGGPLTRRLKVGTRDAAPWSTVPRRHTCSIL
jgi:hypothetical protein